jgi:putative transposase
MPSSARGKCVDGIYHIFQRGNNKEFLFNDDETKGMLIHFINDFKIKFDFVLLGFVIMNNHYHLLIKINKDPLNEIMFNINNTFAHYLNRTLIRTGHVYESRYKCKRVDNDSYLLWLLRYIHRNPIRAKIVAEVDNYKWSSHFFYKNGINGTVNAEYILGIISSKKSQGILKYMNLVNAAGNDNNQEEDYKKCREGISLFSQFDNEGMFNNNKKVIRKSLEEIASLIFIDEAKKALILAGCKKRELTPIKLDFIREAIALKYTYKEIAGFLRISESTARTMISRYRT